MNTMNRNCDPLTLGLMPTAMCARCEMRLTGHLLSSIVLPRGNPRNYAISFSPYLRLGGFATNGRPTTYGWRPRRRARAPCRWPHGLPITSSPAAVSRAHDPGQPPATDRRPVAPRTFISRRRTGLGPWPEGAPGALDMTFQRHQPPRSFYPSFLGQQDPGTGSETIPPRPECVPARSCRPDLRPRRCASQRGPPASTPGTPPRRHRRMRAGRPELGPPVRQHHVSR